MSVGGTAMVSMHEALPEAYCDEYWAFVKRALVEVFSVDARAADALRERLRTFEQERKQPQTLFYHADPFEIAADLAGREGHEITPEERARYQDLLCQEDRPPNAHMRAVHPEDA